MMNTWRVDEIEARLMDALRRLSIAESRLAAAEQRAAAGSSSTPSSGSGGGGFYADPGSVVVAAGDEETLVVMEARAGGGDVEMGEKTVVNRYPDDTEEGLRLTLVKNSDGSYLIVGQACPEPEE